jgi:P pilus assembly chaperone PapD
VRVLLQIWMAQADNSAAVIIDGADIVVNRPLRNGLFNLLRKVDLPALVTMALPGDARENRKLFPDLKKAKRGVSYWIENNELVEVGK